MRSWSELGRLVGLSAAVGLAFIGVLIVTEGAARDAWAGDRFSDGVPLHEHVDAWELLDAKVDLARDAGDVDMVVLGDSSGLNGFVPDTFSEVTGRSAVNLATHGMAGFAGHRALLREAYRCGSESRNVLLWIHPRTLDRSDEDIEKRGFHRWLRNRIDGMFDRGNAVCRAYDTWGGLLRYRLLRKRMRRRDGSRRATSWRAELMASHGFLPRRRPGTALNDCPQEPHADALAGVTAIAEFCSSRGIALHIVIMPQTEGSPVTSAHLRDVVRRLSASAPAAEFIDTVPDFFPRAWFADAGHLYEPRAPEMTRMVAEYFERHGLR